MGLADRIRRRQPEPEPAHPVEAQRALRAVPAPRDSGYQELKSRVHNRLFDHLDLSQLPHVSEEKVAREIAQLTRQILDQEQVPLTEEERARIALEIRHEVFGLGVGQGEVQLLVGQPGRLAELDLEAADALQQLSLGEIVPECFDVPLGADAAGRVEHVGLDHPAPRVEHGRDGLTRRPDHSPDILGAQSLHRGLYGTSLPVRTDADRC